MGLSSVFGPDVFTRGGGEGRGRLVCEEDEVDLEDVVVLTGKFR